MQPFSTHTGIVIPLNRENVDTDAIVPKQYLKKLEKTGYGDHLFDDDRYLDPGDVDTPIGERRVNPDFFLNQEPYNMGSILVSQANFGCGSSREHAVWALKDFGVRVVIAPSFGEIFYNNCFNNGLLPIIIEKSLVDELLQRAASERTLELSVDLDAMVVRSGSDCWSFKLDEGRRQALLLGLDEIGISLERRDSIRAYEENRKRMEPWLFQ